MCPVCKCSEFIIIGPPSYNPSLARIIRKDYKVVKCTECNLYYLDPLIDFSPDEWELLYNSHYFSQKSSKAFFHQ